MQSRGPAGKRLTAYKSQVVGWQELGEAPHQGLPFLRVERSYLLLKGVEGLQVERTQKRYQQAPNAGSQGVQLPLLEDAERFHYMT